MKISAKKIIVLSLAAGIVTGSIPASAFMSIAKGSDGMGRASVNELAHEDVAILPGNPFHFVIGISNSFKGFFISDKLREASFKLEIAGRRAGEVRKLLDWAADNAELLSLSLSNYNSALLEFERKVRVLSRSDLNEDASAQINEMVSRLLTQLRFVDDIRDSFTASSDVAILATIDQTLAGSLRFIALNLDDTATFASRITSAVTERSDAATAIRVVGILAKIVQDVAGAAEAADFVAAIADAREAVIADLAKAIRAESALVAPETSMAVAAFKKAPAPVNEAPVASKVSDIVNQLADETLKAEIYALLRPSQ